MATNNKYEVILRDIYYHEDDFKDMISDVKKSLAENETIECSDLAIIPYLKIPESKLIAIAKNNIEDDLISEDWCKGKKFGFVLRTGGGEDLLYCFDNKKFYHYYHSDDCKESDGISYSELIKSIDEFYEAKYNKKKDDSSSKNDSVSKAIAANNAKIEEIKKKGNLSLRDRMAIRSLENANSNMERLKGRIRESGGVDMSIKENAEVMKQIDVTLQETNDGKDDKYVKEIDTIIAKDYKALTKNDLNTLAGNIKKISDNHLKAKYKTMAIDILVRLIIHGVIGVIAPYTLALLPLSIAYCIMIGNIEVPENANKDMARNVNDLERARSEMQQKIFELKRKQKVGELSDDEEEILKVYSKNYDKLGDAIHGLKAATFRNAYGAKDLDESAEEKVEEKHYLYESINPKSLNEIIM